MNQLKEITNKNSSDEIINQYVYEYDQQDQRAKETITNGLPVTGLQNELITCNYNTVNQLLNSTNPDKNFKYDADGNMTKGYTPEGYAFTAVYDAENRLKSIEYTDSASFVHKTEYIYRSDSFLARIKKYENNTLVDDTRIIRDGFLPVQERDANNNTVREYAWGSNMGGGIGGLLNLKLSGQNYACLYDGKGNVTSVLDNSQVMVASYRYDAFGKLMSKTGALNQPFMFSTKRYDGRIYILIMTTFLPYVLSGGISGFLVENVLIENIALSTQFFSKYKIGSIVGCVLGRTCFFYLLLSFGSIGGVLIGGLAEIFLGPKSVLLGMCLGTMVASVVLILSGSFIGLFLGAFADSLVRGLMKIVT